MTDESAEGGVSKKSVKKAKGDAEKASNKKPDPEGLALIEQGVTAFEKNELEQALARSRGIPMQG